LNRALHWIILLGSFFIFFSIHINETQAVELQGIPIELSGETKAVLTDTPIELFGPTAETNFYYNIYSKLEERDYYVQFEVSNSELLIEPSTLTIKIDGEPVQSVSLAGTTSQTIKVNLNHAALEEGTHTITVVFSGNIAAGVCLPQNTTGNWVKILPSSFINLYPYNNQHGLSLKDYPERYLGSESQEVLVIIPTKPSTETLQSALMVANYLSGLSSQDHISIVNEDEVEKITGNMVVVGGVEEFQAGWMRELLQANGKEPGEHSLYISQLPLTQNNHAITALLILAKQPEEILNKISILTNDYYIEQLSGESIEIEQLPEMIEENDEITLSSFGLDDLLLDSNDSKSQTYFYYLPVDKKSVSQPSLELKLKKTQSIKNAKSAEELSISDTQVELIVYINDIPHSIDINSLKEDKEGNITVRLPFDKNILNDNRLISIQFEATGLRVENPCAATDQNRWIYLFADSAFHFPMKSSNQDMDAELFFNSFPVPFSDKNKDLLIVLPDEEIPNKDLQNLFSVLTLNGKLPSIRLLSSSEVTEDLLNQGNVIFIGSVSQHDVLKKVVDRLIVNYENLKPQLSRAGFIEESVEYYSFMQKNPWNDDHYMAVFDHLKDTDHYFSLDFLQFLSGSNNAASIAVQTGPGSYFTNAQLLKNEAGQQTEEPAQSNERIIWISSFIALTVILVILILFYLKKRKYS